MRHLINRSRVRDYTFAMLEARRPALKGKMTRISREFYDRVDAAARNFIAGHLDSLPSTGKTIK